MKDLKDMIRLETFELENQFCLKPQTKADLFFDKLKSNQIYNIQVQSNDDNIEKETLTDEIRTADTFN